MNPHRFYLIVLITIGILLVPFIAMQFTHEVNWSSLDFVIAGLLILGTGVMIDLAIRTVRKSKIRFVFYLAIVILLLLLWAEMAVGLFGTPIAGD